MQTVAGAEDVLFAGLQPYQADAVVEAVGCAAEVFDGDAATLGRQVDLQNGIAVIGQDIELQAFVFEAAGGGVAGFVQQKTVVQLDAGQRLRPDKARVFDLVAVWYQILVESETAAAVEAELPAVGTAAEGEIGMPAVGQRQGAMAGIGSGGGEADALVAEGVAYAEAVGERVAGIAAGIVVCQLQPGVLCVAAGGGDLEGRIV